MRRDCCLCTFREIFGAHLCSLSIIQFVVDVVVAVVAAEDVEVAEVERSELSEVFVFRLSYSFSMNILTSWFCTSFGSRDYRQQSGGGQYGGESFIC